MPVETEAQNAGLIHVYKLPIFLMNGWVDAETIADGYEDSDPSGDLGLYWPERMTAWNKAAFEAAKTLGCPEKPLNGPLYSMLPPDDGGFSASEFMVAFGDMMHCFVASPFPLSYLEKAALGKVVVEEPAVEAQEMPDWSNFKVVDYTEGGKVGNEEAIKRFLADHPEMADEDETK